MYTMKKLSIVITEIFLVKVGYDKTFVGEVVREVLDLDVNNRLTVLFHGSVVINEGKIWSKGKSQDELGENLDAIATMKLDGNLHGDKGKYINLGCIYKAFKLEKKLITIDAVIPYCNDVNTFYLN